MARKEGQRRKLNTSGSTVMGSAMTLAEAQEMLTYLETTENHNHLNNSKSTYPSTCANLLSMI